MRMLRKPLLYDDDFYTPNQHQEKMLDLLNKMEKHLRWLVMMGWRHLSEDGIKDTSE